LPDNLSHEVKANHFAKFNDFGMNGNDFVATVIRGTGKLIADIDTQPATVVQHAVTFLPCKVQMIDIGFVIIVKTDLIFRSVIFQLPVGRRRNNQMNAPVCKLAHLPTVAVDYGMYRFINHPNFIFAKVQLFPEFANDFFLWHSDKAV
jgi:hypothetical protein